MVNICIIALIGLPGSGKTTFCKNMVNYPSEYKFIHICYDEIFHFHPAINVTFKNERRKVTHKIKEMIDEIKSSTRQDNGGSCSNPSSFYVMLVDDNNYYAGMRYEIYKICKANQLSFGQIYFPIDVESALARNAARGTNALPSHVIEKMNNRLESPSEKSQWERNSLIIHNSGETEQFWEFLKIWFHNPINSTLNTNDQTRETNFIHEVDICLRKRIKELLQNYQENLGEMAKLLNKRRKCILLDIKSGNYSEAILNIDSICERLTL